MIYYIIYATVGIIITTALLVGSEKITMNDIALFVPISFTIWLPLYIAVLINMYGKKELWQRGGKDHE